MKKFNKYGAGHSNQTSQSNFDWKYSDLSIQDVRNILRSSGDEICINTSNSSENAIKELISIYEENKMYYGYSVLMNKQALKRELLPCEKQEIIEEWMVQNMQQQQMLTKHMTNKQVFHLMSIYTSYFLMGKDFQDIAKKTFKFQ